MPVVDLMDIAEYDLVLVFHPGRHCYFLGRYQLHVSLAATRMNANVNTSRWLSDSTQCWMLSACLLWQRYITYACKCN